MYYSIIVTILFAAEIGADASIRFEHESVTFECLTTDVNVRWTYRGIDNSDITIYEHQTLMSAYAHSNRHTAWFNHNMHALKITDLTLTDTGVYACGVGTTFHQVILLRVIPTWNPSAVTIAIDSKAGDSAELSCPYQKVDWYKTSKTKPPSFVSRSIIGTLTIASTQASDSGIYACIGTADVQYVALTVQANLLNQSTIPVTINKYDGVNFKCCRTPNSVNVSWYYIDSIESFGFV